MIVKIFTGPLNYDVNTLYNQEDNEYIIAVDQALKILIDNDIKIDLALGDFDSLDETYEYYLNHKNVLKYPSTKDYTDTYLAIKEALKLDPKEILIYGGLGERLDHTLANLSLLKLGNITMENDTEITFVLSKGKYEISEKNQYISFFALEDTFNFNLQGFKYELINHEFLIDDPICISNEGTGTVSFDKGLILVVIKKI
ncbi:thiamine diphosphokinase [Candidatus Izimaplasma bacterium ZiA1]|uniref:thiamine diphosphokinase n=1 Tax=Candidatus Izimoplasma sp. ZiA1 TaxID=2024899 RepID=UPI000BAA5785|nr:thiamine diphosphokinase [Candidatus Izimaplasma bacterium ZiA1]